MPSCISQLHLQPRCISTAQKIHLQRQRGQLQTVLVKQYSQVQKLDQKNGGRVTMLQLLMQIGPSAQNLVVGKSDTRLIHKVLAPKLVEWSDRTTALQETVLQDIRTQEQAQTHSKRGG